MFTYPFTMKVYTLYPDFFMVPQDFQRYDVKHMEKWGYGYVCVENIVQKGEIACDEQFLLFL